MSYLPPGKYYIGDPCYVFSDKRWRDFLNSKQKDELTGTEKSAVSVNGNVHFLNYHFWYHNTAFGDGAYTGTNGFEYGVDSASLGIVPVEIIDKESNNGTMHDFPEGVDVSFNNGIFKFNEIEINTEIDYDEEIDYNEEIDYDEE